MAAARCPLTGMLGQEDVALGVCRGLRGSWVPGPRVSAGPYRGLLLQGVRAARERRLVAFL